MPETMIAGSALCSRDYAGRSLESGVALLVQQIVVSNLLDKTVATNKEATVMLQITNSASCHRHYPQQCS